MKLVANNLYRGKRPQSFSMLQSFGIKVVVNLESGVYEALHDDGYEIEDGADFGIVEHEIKCSNIFVPERWQVKKFLEIVTKTSDPVYIHCKWGRDRTGFMCAAYRIVVCGWTANEAIEEMLREGFREWSYFHWIRKLRPLENMSVEDL